MKSILPLFALALACASCAGESPSSAGPAVATVSVAPPSTPPEGSTLTEAAGSNPPGAAASGENEGLAGTHHSGASPTEHARYGGTASPAVAAEARRIAPEELRPLLDGGEAVLVDVRGESDWAFYRAAEAIHIPFAELAARSVELPHEALIALYCT